MTKQNKKKEYKLASVESFDSSDSSLHQWTDSTDLRTYFHRQTMPTSTQLQQKPHCSVVSTSPNLPQSFQPQVTFATSATTYTEASTQLEQFVTNNKWRLHDLFSRLKNDAEDYRLPADVICSFLELCGGIRTASRSEKAFFVMLKSNKFRGSLIGINPAFIKRFVCQCGMDVDGKVDYRVIVDNHRVCIMNLTMSLFYFQPKL